MVTLSDEAIAVDALFSTNDGCTARSALVCIVDNPGNDANVRTLEAIVLPLRSEEVVKV